MLESQMENELKTVQKELVTTKSALKVQTARCRHLVSAFTKKLNEKDAEIQHCRSLREKQLSSLLRALLVLEARLRREQKSIREMLAEKDNIINEQKQEIEKLKASVELNIKHDIPEETNIILEDKSIVECREVLAKPDLISSLGIREGKEESDSSDTASTKSCLGDESDYTVLCSPRVLNVHDRSAFSPIRGRPEVKPEPKEDYQDNPVLQCVNQILLKDQEDFLEEQRLRVKDNWDEEDSAVDEEENSPTKVEEIKNDEARVIPPSLPPKPKRSSGKRVEFADIKPQFHNPPPVLPAPQSMDPPLALPLSILEHVEQSQDNELYVISNSALDDEIVKQLRGRTLNVSGLQLKQRNELRKHSNVPMGLLHPNHNTSLTKDESNQSVVFNHHYPQPKQVLKVSIQESPKRSSFGMSPPKVGMPDTIKVASPVATLLTSENQKDSPSVSQMVRRFEDLGTQKPEEEKKEEPKEIVSYDNFLEATGLSQKSIMTPSRMMTNHRSVMKPKDVKLRSKVKAAGVIERCIPPQVVGPTVKYWTEPFL